MAKMVRLPADLGQCGLVSKQYMLSTALVGVAPLADSYFVLVAR